MAYRGRIPLEDIAVDFGVAPVEHHDGPGFGVRKKVTVKGDLSETDLLRLRRAAEYCSVGQLFTKGALAIEDQVEWATAAVAQALQPAPGRGNFPLPPGAVAARWLPETREYGEDGAMLQEGEVKLYVSCEGPLRPSRWVLIGGHGSQGWMPAPVVMALGGLAASTAATVEATLSPPALRVEIERHGVGGGKGEVQAAAAAGVVRSRQAVRRAVLPEIASREEVVAAMRRAPLYRAFTQGGVLLGEEVVIG